MKTLREGAEEVARRLRAHGFEAYFAGGCVRDRVLGIPPKDFDVVTNAKPEEVSGLFKRTIQVGAAFGVVKVQVGRGLEYEVATYRTDGVYIDGRRPDEVRYSDSVEEDVKRRDFTINALLEDPDTGEILDFVGGRDDLEAGVIRAVGDAKKRVAEDRLRMLRAVRFAARFGFTIEPDTLDAVASHAAEIVDVSPERITAELEGIWSSARPGLGLRLLDASGLRPHVLPFLHDVAAAALRLDRLASLGREPEPARWIAWAVLFGGAALARADIDRRMRALKLSREHIRNVQLLVAALGEPETIRLVVSESAPLIADFLRAYHGDPSEPVRAWRAVEAELARDPLPPLPVLTGEDLKALGIAPGPAFKRILDDVERGVLFRRIRSKEEAVHYVRAQYLSSL